MGGRSKAKTEEGREFARAVIVQDEQELQVIDGQFTDVNPQALRNPVVRKLRAQLREGVGPKEYQLPPTTFGQLVDRWAGKVVDRVKMAVTERPYEGETDEQLKQRLDDLRSMLDRRKAEETSDE